MSKKKECSAIKKNNEPCSAAASENGFCFTHDPTRGKERALARRKGGLQNRAPSPGDKEKIPDEIRSIENIFSVLDYALVETLALPNGIQRGRLLVSIAHGYIEVVKAGEMEQRLEAVEYALRLRKVEKQQQAKIHKGRFGR